MSPGFPTASTRSAAVAASIGLAVVLAAVSDLSLWQTAVLAGAFGGAVLAWTAWDASVPDRQASHPFAAGGAAMAPLGAVSRSVVDALDGSPSTRRELGATVDADATSLDRALNELQARGLVVHTGSEYRIADDGTRVT